MLRLAIEADFPIPTNLTSSTLWTFRWWSPGVKAKKRRKNLRDRNFFALMASPANRQLISPTDYSLKAFASALSARLPQPGLLSGFTIRCPVAGLQPSCRRFPGVQSCDPVTIIERALWEWDAGVDFGSIFMGSLERGSVRDGFISWQHANHQRWCHILAIGTLSVITSCWQCPQQLTVREDVRKQAKL